jgi:hypothetical protein
MRLIQAVSESTTSTRGPLNKQAGLHRDGTRWGLPDVQVEERRRVFWEAHTTDVFQVS